MLPPYSSAIFMLLVFFFFMVEMHSPWSGRVGPGAAVECFQLWEVLDGLL